MSKLFWLQSYKNVWQRSCGGQSFFLHANSEAFWEVCDFTSLLNRKGGTGRIKCTKTVGLYLWCLKVLHTLSVVPQPSLISAAQSLSSCSGCATVVKKFWRPSHKLFHIIYRVASELTFRINNWSQGRAQIILACQRYFGIGLMCPVYMGMLL